MTSRICVVLAIFFIFTINNVYGANEVPNLLVTSEPFKFGYFERDLLQMNISFKLPPDINAGHLMLSYRRNKGLRYQDSIEKVEIRRPWHGDELDDPVAAIKSFTKSDRVFIFVHLYNETGLSVRKLMLDGRAVKSNNLESAYGLVCSNGNRCEVKADLRKPNDYTTVIIVLSVLSLAMFLLAIVALVIIAFKKRWCSKKEMPELIPEVPEKPMYNFYENLLFAKDSHKILKEEGKKNQPINTADREN